MKNGLKLAALYTAIIMGAGFASGQELLRYFVSYGTSGIWGLIVSGILFAVTGWAVLDICHSHSITDYRSFMAYLMGDRLGRAIEWIVAAFLFVLFVAMLSAGGAMLEQSKNIPFAVGVVALASIILLFLWFGLDGIIKLNAFLSPILIAGGIFFGLYTFFNHTTETFFQNQIIPGWILAAVVYASYNMVTMLSVLTVASKVAKSRKECMLGGILGGASLTLLGLCMALPLYLYFADIIAVEIPFLVIVTGHGSLFSYLYIGLMLCAIITTAVINAFALIEWTLGYIKINRRVLCAILATLGIPAAFIGFSNIVGYVYPLFGLLGIFQIIVVLLSWRRKSDILHPDKSYQTILKEK